MIARELLPKLSNALAQNPAVVLMGPRQVGKTTLALEMARNETAVYLDLERQSDLAKISDVAQYCDLHADELLILDEVHRVPNLFVPLRSIIDQRRREGRRTGLFLLLGSASMDLLRQSGESLAGRVAYCELHPIGVSEVHESEYLSLWCRGGFPESFLASRDGSSLDWRLDFIRTYLERDIPQFGPRIPAETLRRFWTMLAHNQGQTFNASAYARSLDVKSVTTARYLDLMVDLLLVRRLPAWTSNMGRRLIKAPKIYFRDSGICHALLGIADPEALLAHPVAGSSWEGFVIENLLSSAPKRSSFGFYRTAGGAEVDLVIETPPRDLWAIEIKRSRAPTVSRGFHSACEDLQPKEKFVVHAGDESFPLGDGILAVTVPDLKSRLEAS